MRLISYVVSSFLLMGILGNAKQASARGARAMGEASSLSFAEDAFDFEYWQMMEPYQQVSCQHKKAEGFFDWYVSCDVAGQTRDYLVHLVVHFYNQTIYGKSAYEILYWVTDRSRPDVAQNNSSTIWVHNSSEDNRMQLLEVEQGVENDLAALRLRLKPH